VQTPYPLPLHHVLRPEEFIDRQVIAAANLLDCVHATEHRIDDRGLARRGIQRLVSGGGNSSDAFLVRGELSFWSFGICN